MTAGAFELDCDAAFGKAFVTVAVGDFSAESCSNRAVGVVYLVAKFGSPFLRKGIFGILKNPSIDRLIFQLIIPLPGMMPGARESMSGTASRGWRFTMAAFG